MEENQSRFSSLLVTILLILTILSLFGSYKLWQQLKSLSETVAYLESNAAVSGLSDTPAEQQSSLQQSAVQQSPVQQPSTDAGRSAVTDERASAPARNPDRKVRYVPDVKVRVDDHYTIRDAEFPDVSFQRDQKVVIDVIVNQLGIVTKASVGSGTTVQDEDVLYVCKMAALKIRFSFNPDAPSRIAGKITYSYIPE